MTVVYILVAALVCYALLVLFRQQATLKDQVARLEQEKKETEQMLLQFMENVNAMADVSVEHAPVEPSADSEITAVSLEQKIPDERGVVFERETTTDQVPALTDVKQALKDGTDLETLARSLNRGIGEVALIAKLSRQTKVAPR